MFLNHGEWFPAHVANLLSPTEALTFAAGAKCTRAVRLRDVPLPTGWESGRQWDGPGNVYEASKWQSLAGNSETSGALPQGGGTPPPSAPALKRLPSSDGQGDAGGTHTTFVSLLWRDQGWGNRKGMVSVVDENGTAGDGPDGQPLPARAPNDYKAWGPCVVAGAEPAPHQQERLRLAFRPKKGGSYALWYRAGGGGGHRLEIQGCTVKALEFCTGT